MSQLPSEHEYATSHRKLIERSYSRNVHATYAMAVIGGLASAFSHGGVIMPLFVNQMTDRKIAVGILSAGISVGFFFPQLFGAYFIHPIRRVKGFIAIAYVSGVVIMLGLACVALFMVHQPWPALVTFLCLSWVYFSFYGFVNPAQIVLVGKIIPPEKRGMFFGFQSFFSNGAGILGGFIVAAVLSGWGFPRGYGYCFLIATAFLAINALTFRFIREHDSQLITESTGFFDYIRRFPSICRRDSNFAWFIPARNFMAIANVLIAALLPVYCMETFPVTFREEDAGFFTMAFMLGQCLASPIFGYFGSRFGFGKVMVASAVLHIVRLIALLVIPLSFIPLEFIRPGVYIAFFLSGMFLNALVLASNTLVLNFSPVSERPSYIALANGTRTPFLLVAPILGGWLVDHYSYGAAFWTSIGFAIAAIVLFAWKIRDPGPTE